MPAKISVFVKPHAKKENVAQLPDGDYQVSVHAPAHDGKANRAVIELLSRHFSLPKARIKIVRGHSSRRKLVEIV